MNDTSTSPLRDAPDRVLSTLQSDGRRRWLRPRLSIGRWWRRRQAVAYLLMIVFVMIPHLRINGKPLILLDIVARKFTIFGRTFLPNDTLVLALFLLTVFVSIVLVTAIAGRAWCGWACPQTVYMEFLFRPIDRLFEGTVGKGGTPRNPMSGLRYFVRLAVYVALSMFLAHTFLAYFVGTEQLGRWVRSSPIEHPTAFLVMAGTTGLILFDFLFFREQMCTLACPYGRFQSVMLDRQSLIVGYDHVRGEPRKKGKRIEGQAAGDCVDCNQCVVVCPTGIDIRDGLQMECINCTQCIDACDSVMDRVGKPSGLIRFSSQDAIDGKPKRLARARTLIYPLILVSVLGGLVFAVGGKLGFDARVIRGKGAPFTIIDGGEVSNSLSLRLVNRTEQMQSYELTILTPESVALDVIDAAALKLKPGESRLVPFGVRFSSRETSRTGNRKTLLRIHDQAGNERTAEFAYSDRDDRDMTELESQAERRAKRFWISLVTILLGLQLTIGAAAVYLSTGDRSVAVVPDYHRSALHWDDVRRARGAAERIGWTLGLSTSDVADARGMRAVEFFVHDADNFGVSDLEIAAQLYHHAAASEVAPVAFQSVGDGRYLAMAPMNRPGLWQIEVTIQGAAESMTFQKTIEVGEPQQRRTIGAQLSLSAISCS